MDKLSIDELKALKRAKNNDIKNNVIIQKNDRLQ